MKPPRFSVIVPSYQRPRQLRACLESLAALNYPADGYEIIVVDDGGGQDLQPLTRDLRPGLDITLLQQPNSGPGAARNKGAASARGGHLVFTDDDCRPQPDWLLAYAAAIAHHPADLLGGDTTNGLPHNLWSEGSQAVQTWLYDYFDREDADWRFFASNNICVPTQAFLRLGGFDTETIVFASEDRELSERWVHHGGRLRHVPGARVVHLHQLSLGEFLRQHFAYGRGAFRLGLARARKGLPAPARDKRWIMRYLFRYPWSEPGLSRKFRLFFTAWVSFVATVVGHYYEKADHGPSRTVPPP